MTEAAKSTSSSAAQSQEKTITIRVPNKMFNVEYSSDIEFFKRWCVFLKPFMPMTAREIDVMSNLLKYRWKLSKTVSDSNALDILLMSDEAKAEVTKACGISLQHYYVVLNSLKKKGAILKNAIVPQLIPNIREGDNGVFRLLIQFKEEKHS